MADGARIVSITAVGPDDYRVELLRDGITRGFVFTVEDGLIPVVSAPREFNVAMHYNQSDALALSRAVAAVHEARKTPLQASLDLVGPWRALLAQAVASDGLEPATLCPICAAQQVRLEVTGRNDDGSGCVALWCESCRNGVFLTHTPVPAGHPVFDGALPEFFDLTLDGPPES
jgi:hypothetical protein